MIEAGANEVPEAKMIEAIYLADETNKKIIAFIDTIVAECGKPKHDYVSCAIPEELFAAIREEIPQEEMEQAVFTDDRSVREANIAAYTEKLREKFADQEEWLAVLDDAMYQYQKKTIRKMILKDHKRPDGRAIRQIRPLAAEVDTVPRVHGSAMFTRGQTQICNVVTLAPLSEAQRVDGLDPYKTEKRYMHQYNFPSYSVGETKPSRGPGRREIGRTGTPRDRPWRAGGACASSGASGQRDVPLRDPFGFRDIRVQRLHLPGFGLRFLHGAYGCRRADPENGSRNFLRSGDRGYGR